MRTIAVGSRRTRRVIVAVAVMALSLMLPAAGFTSATATGPVSCVTDYYLIGQWRAYLAVTRIANTGDQTIEGWQLSFDLPAEHTVVRGWNGRFKQNGSAVEVTNRRRNQTVAPGGSTWIGFVGRFGGDFTEPTNFALNGRPCKPGEVNPTTTTTTIPETTTTTIPETTTTSAPSTTIVTTSTSQPTTTGPTTTTSETTTTTTQPTTSTTARPTTTSEVTTTTRPPTTTTRPPTTTTRPTTTTTETTTTTQPTTSTTEPPRGSNEESNLRLIMGNATRNTQFDDNPYRDVPMSRIAVEDLTVDGDIYTEGLLNTDVSGYFRVKCEVSHFAYDDPIVYPGQPGRAHLHMFFGNTQTNAFSTFDSLLNRGTGTCNGEDLNRTAYWVPAVLDRGGNALVPFEIMVYYKNDNFMLNGANELVEPFPDNLRMIAGNGGATEAQTTRSGGPGSHPVVSFLCGPAYGGGNQRSALIPDCYGTGQGPYNGRALEMQIAFPQCYDPSSETYLADGSHMSYSEGGYYGARCPRSHPHDVSSIMYRIFFNPDAYGGSLTDLHLSSDVRHHEILPGGTTSHADWFGAWHPEAMRRWVQNCNNTRADCEIGLLGRDPAVSLVKRKRGFYPAGYRADAEELLKLCPGKEFDPARPLHSVANCRH